MLYVAVGLEKTVRNMLTSLKAVSELQNPAIRDRHWQQLMNATGVSEPPIGRHCRMLCTASFQLAKRSFIESIPNRQYMQYGIMCDSEEKEEYQY